MAVEKGQEENVSGIQIRDNGGLSWDRAIKGNSWLL